MLTLKNKTKKHKMCWDQQNKKKKNKYKVVYEKLKIEFEMV